MPSCLECRDQISPPTDKWGTHFIVLDKLQPKWNSLEGMVISARSWKLRLGTSARHIRTFEDVEDQNIWFWCSVVFLWSRPCHRIKVMRTWGSCLTDLPGIEELGAWWSLDKIMTLYYKLYHVGIFCLTTWWHITFVSTTRSLLPTSPCGNLSWKSYCHQGQRIRSTWSLHFTREARLWPGWKKNLC